MEDFTIRVLDDLPCDGMVMESPDGHCNIYLSGKLGYDEQLHVCLHELAHIKYGHLHDDRDVEEMEKEAENFANEKIGDLRGENLRTINVSTALGNALSEVENTA